jgi:hypothetical protein
MNHFNYNKSWAGLNLFVGPAGNWSPLASKGGPLHPKAEFTGGSTFKSAA